MLGRLEAREGSRVLHISARKERILLALLLLNVNAVVPSDRLIDDIWGGSPPGTALNTLQAYVSRLRKILGRHRIVTSPPGYVLRASADEVDLARFQALAAAGRVALANGEATSAAEGLRDALALWRGDALSEFQFDPFARGAIARLEEERTAALEDRLDADLALGHHSRLIGELAALVTENPFRERLHMQLMLALYRSGRQAEALSAYRAARETLIAELGIEPSPAVKQLQTAILLQDPSLDPAPLPNSPVFEARDRTTAHGETVRKLVSIVVSDLTTTTTHDRDGRAALRTRALSRFRQIITTHSGVCIPGYDHDLVGFFGLPTVHEDDAARAIRAAINIHAEAAALTSAFERNRRMGFNVRTAVETLEVISLDGEPIEEVALNEAVMLSSAAEDGDIVISDVTRRLVEGKVRMERTTGGSGWRVIAVADENETQTPARHCSLLGRDMEVSQLLQAFEATQRKRTCHLFTVFGSAGIGKSRLASEFVDRLGDHARVLVGRCPPYGDGTTFWPLAEMAEQAVGPITEAAVERIVVGMKHRDTISRRVASLLGSAGTGEPDAFWALRKFFEALAQLAPLILVIDDIHWAEPMLLDFIEDLAGSSRNAAILLLCLARPELLEGRPSWSGGRYNASSFSLEPLSADAASTLIQALCVNTALSQHHQLRVEEVAGGNPFFIEQMIALASEGTEQIEMAPTIHAILAARLDRLPVGERAVLQRASVIGPDFSSKALDAMFPPGGGRDTRQTLESLVQKDLLQPSDYSPMQEDAFRFKHHLISETAYKSIPGETLSGLHANFAGWLEESFADRVEEVEEVIAYHLEAACRCHPLAATAGSDARKLQRRASHFMASAGRIALRRSDISAAANLLTRAVSLAATDDPATAGTLCSLAVALREGGDLQRAERSLDQALDIVIEHADTALTAHVRANLLHHRLFVEPNLTTDAIIDQASALLEQLSICGHARYAANVRATLAWAHLLNGQASEAESFLNTLVAFGRQESDLVIVNDSRKLLLAVWLYGPTQIQDTASGCERILREEPPPRVAASAFRYLALARAMEGRFGEARIALANDRDILDDLGLAVLAAAATEIYGLVELLAGDPVAAERELEIGLRILAKLGERMYLSGVAAVLAQALYTQGRYDEAYELTETSANGAVRDVAAPVHWRGTRAKILFRQGQGEEAERLAREAVTLAERTDFLDLRGEALMDLAEVLRLAGRSAEADRASHRALRLFERKGNVVSAERARATLLSATHAAA